MKKWRWFQKIQNTNWKWMKNPKLAICKWMKKTQNTSRKCMENQQRKWTRDVSLRWTQFKKKIGINVHFWTTTGELLLFFVSITVNWLEVQLAKNSALKILYGVKCQQAWNYTTEQSRVRRRSGSTSNSSAPVLHQMIPELFQEWMTQWLQGQKWWQNLIWQ